jgi:type 1 glutamine amidotransferase
MSRVRVITGGPDYAHDFLGPNGTGPAVMRVLRDAGHQVDCTDDIEAGFLNCGEVDVVVINALRWRMMADQYAQWRDQWAFSPSAEARRRIVDFVEGGGGLVACHTAMICFDDWDEWGDLIGGRWVWGTSSHPAPALVKVSLTDASHPVVAGLHEMELVDEVYGDVAMGHDISVLATARRHVDDAEQPVVWTRHAGRGRVVVNGFGHDVASIMTPAHQQLLRQAVSWSAARDSEPMNLNL